MNKKTRSNLFTDSFIQRIAQIITIIGLLLIFTYYNLSQINDCTSDPLKYLSNKLEDEENISLKFIVIEYYSSSDDYEPMIRKEIDLNNLTKK